MDSVMDSVIREIYKNYLTNREALPVLFSVVKRQEAASARKKCNVKTCLAFFFTSRRKKLVRSSGDGQAYYSFVDGMTALAELYVLYFVRASSFNRWQRALYPNFIIKLNDPCGFNFVHQSNDMIKPTKEYTKLRQLTGSSFWNGSLEQ